jgi:hypothetical protein
VDVLGNASLWVDGELVTDIGSFPNVPDFPSNLNDFPSFPHQPPLLDRTKFIPGQQCMDFNCGGLAFRTYKWVETEKDALSTLSKYGIETDCDEPSCCFGKETTCHFFGVRSQLILKDGSGKVIDSQLPGDDWHVSCGTGSLTPQKWGVGTVVHFDPATIHEGMDVYVSQNITHPLKGNPNQSLWMRVIKIYEKRCFCVNIDSFPLK